MPIPDICLSKGGSDQLGIGNSDFIGGGPGLTGVLTSDKGIQYTHSIGSMCCSRPVINTMAEAKRQFIIQLMRPDGSPLDLTNVGQVRFRARETYDATTYHIDKLCEITSSAINGIVTLDLLASDVPWGGVWVAAFQLLDPLDILLTQYDVYLFVNKGLNSSSNQNRIISISDVRMALLDRCPEDSSLLDSFEFSDAECCYAIQRVVDRWNEMPPRIAGALYTYATFPYRYNWIEGVVGELFKMASRKLFRNKLDYSAGGLNVTDKSRAPVYAQWAKELEAQWTEWAKREKFRINAENCYGSINSKIYF